MTKTVKGEGAHETRKTIHIKRAVWADDTSDTSDQWCWEWILHTWAHEGTHRGSEVGKPWSQISNNNGRITINVQSVPFPMIGLMSDVTGINKNDHASQKTAKNTLAPTLIQTPMDHLCFVQVESKVLLIHRDGFYLSANIYRVCTSETPHFIALLQQFYYLTTKKKKRKNDFQEKRKKIN